MTSLFSNLLIQSFMLLLCKYVNVLHEEVTAFSGLFCQSFVCRVHEWSQVLRPLACRGHLLSPGTDCRKINLQRFCHIVQYQASKTRCGRTLRLMRYYQYKWCFSRRATYLHIICVFLRLGVLVPVCLIPSDVGSESFQ